MSTIARPTLLVNEQIARRNIQKIIDKSQRHGLSFRPHFKTHQSKTVGEWYKELGVNKITVSSVVMASYFVAHNWKDVLIAFPYNPLEAAEIDELATKSKIGILIESAEALLHATTHINNPVDYHIGIDVGYHRTGISYKNAALVTTLLHSTTHHNAAGIVTHAGHTYKSKGIEEIENIHRGSLSNLHELLDNLKEPVFVSYGDTPSCSISEYWQGVDELRCGNMVYYDLTQASIGSCKTEDIAVAVACPVVAKHPERNEVIVYGGGVHFSKEVLVSGEATTYGQAVHLKKDGWEIVKGVYLKGLSQEHGKVSAPSDWIEKLSIGDVIGFLPVHSCMTADLLVLQRTIDGKVVEKLRDK